MADYKLDDAAAAALWSLMHERHEHLGLLYNKDGSVRSTPTESQRSVEKSGGRFRIPKGSLLGIFHNHPELRNASGDPDRAKPSRDDLEQAKKFGVPSYIGAGNTIKRYDPETQETTDVLAQIPLAEIKGQFARRIQNSRMSDEMKRRLLAKLMTPEET